MDSANSGSIQSSSTGGDEEYDSRANSSSISAFLTNNPVPPTIGPFTTQHHHVFDPLSNYLDQTQRSHLNLDMVWSKVARSEPDLGAMIPCSSSSTHNNNQAFLLPHQLGSQSQTRGGVNVVAAAADATALPPARGGLLSVSAANEKQPQNSNGTNTNAVRNPKKRSRASRRAPTTVLTTDTTNFRAMVQEFTGIPAPPFTSSSFPRTRLDLFASSSTPTPTTTSYLLRPFAQKVQAQPSSFPPMLDNNTLASSNNYNPLHMHNTILNHQPPPKYPSHLKMGGLEELGLTHAHVPAHHQNINMDGALSRVNNMRAPSPDWAQPQPQPQPQPQRIANNDAAVLRSLSGTLNYRSNVPDQRLSNGEKGPDCAVAARGEGMVESWINCSSD